jgi:hypothetical protein
MRVPPDRRLVRPLPCVQTLFASAARIILDVDAIRFSAAESPFDIEIHGSGVVTNNVVLREPRISQPTHWSQWVETSR